MAFSSMASLALVERLPRRRRLAVVVGLVPDNPTAVDKERRRRWSFMAAVAMGPGKGAVPPAEIELLRWKRVLRVA